MKKIISINLSGQVIPIEDSAYQQLQDYLASLRRYFAQEEGRDEIINDIESRIAELMTEELRKGASHITDEHVQLIIGTIGRPQDFEGAEADQDTYTEENSGSSYSSTSYATKRLYRNSSDKFLGGVCSGLAAYINIDPAIVRILFAIITLGGLGIGLLAYVLLWIIVPAKDLEGFRGKRLYRNPDDRVFGGVAGGLAAYFNRATWEMRLIFAAPLLLNIIFSSLNVFTWDNAFNVFPNVFFGSITSTFILVYFILWIVLPEARTQYQKMEMRGEAVDLNSIKQKVQEGLSSMGDKVKNWSKEVNQDAKDFGERMKTFGTDRSRDIGRDINASLNRSTHGIAHAIGVLFKVFFFIIVGSIAFGLLVAFIALLFGGAAWWPVNNFLWTSESQLWYAWGTVIFFLLVPLIALITWLVRRIMRIRSGNRYLGWTFGFLWTIGWVAATLLASSIARDFKYYEQADAVSTPVSQPTSGKMIVTVTQPELAYEGTFGWLADEQWDGWDMTPDTLHLAWVNIDVAKSEDSLYHVEIRKFGFGRTESVARERAASIVYSVRSVDSLLDLGNGFAIGRSNKYRGQRVEVLIKVPVGKKIRFSENVRRKLYNKELTIGRSRRGTIRRMEWRENSGAWWQSDVDYTMQVDGTLLGAQGKVTPGNRYDGDRDNYRYEDRPAKPMPPSPPSAPGSQPDSADGLRKQLEEVDRNIRESERQKQELEKQLKSTGKLESLDDVESDSRSSFNVPTSISAMTEWF
ncbi:PspC domain-containing protein [Nostoc ellipsosporum NOK]|nr:PspC domain-containing protein [Nostoc ellipsosporum NOK]